MAIIDELSSEQLHQLSEYQRCKEDLIYFIQNYVMIPTPGGDQHFNLYDRQKEYLDFIEKEKHTIILKSRQVGASTCIQAWCTWVCTFYENAIIGVVSKSGSESSDFAKKTMDMIDKLPMWLQPEFKKRTQQSFILRNGCEFHAAAVSPVNPENCLRGKSLTCAIIDECAFVNYMDRAITGFGPALSKAQQSAKINGIPYSTIIISTPNKTNGTGKWYFDMWKKAQSGLVKYKPFYLHWKQIPEFANDPTWYETQCGILGNVQWRIDQELNCEFVSDDSSFFGSDITKQLNKIEYDPITILTINGHDFKIYEKPDQERFYLIGIDTASSSGSDSSTIWVMDYETGNQVAEFQSKLRVDEFCPIIEEVCKVFPNNILIPECNSYGNQVCEYLSRKGTFNLYQTKTKSTGEVSKKSKFKYGLYTSPMNRPLIMDALYTVVSENVEGIRSKATALELISLVDNGNGKIAADEGEHDDLVMAFAFCCYVRLYDPPKSLYSKTTTQEEKDTINDVISWNYDATDARSFSIAPELSRMYQNVENIEDPIKKEQMINQTYRKFISTNLEKLMEQRTDQSYDTQQGSFINLMNIMDGTQNTFFIN